MNFFTRFDFDIFSHSNYHLLPLATVSDLLLKVNFSPYVLLLDLYDYVDETSVEAKRLNKEDSLKITLKKVSKKPVFHCTILSNGFLIITTSAFIESGIKMGKSFVQ